MELRHGPPKRSHIAVHNMRAPADDFNFILSNSLIYI